MNLSGLHNSLNEMFNFFVKPAIVALSHFGYSTNSRRRVHITILPVGVLAISWITYGTTHLSNQDNDVRGFSLNDLN